MEKMQLDYHKAAEEKGVYAISSCAFDSVPADLGTVFLMNKFQGSSLMMPLLLKDFLIHIMVNKTTDTTYLNVVYKTFDSSCTVWVNFLCLHH